MGKLLESFTPDARKNFAEGASQLVPGIIGLFEASKAKNKERDYLNQIETYQRQELVNPYASVENPYKNLSVATNAAKMQAEQTDIALANTLDTLRETGKGAGGATALAQAALKSKQNVASSIEKQEVNNEKLKAQGQLQVDLYRAKGEGDIMTMREAREGTELDRLQGSADIESARRDAALKSSIGAFTKAGQGALSGLIQPKSEQEQVNEDKSSLLGSQTSQEVKDPSLSRLNPNELSSYYKNSMLDEAADIEIDILDSFSDEQKKNLPYQAANSMNKAQWDLEVETMQNNPNYGITPEGTFATDTENVVLNPFVGNALGAQTLLTYKNLKK